MKKDFNEFLNTLTPEKIKLVIDELPEDYKHSNIKNMLTAGGHISLSISLSLLEMYHIWLFDDAE